MPPTDPYLPCSRVDCAQPGSHAIIVERRRDDGVLSRELTTWCWSCFERAEADAQYTRGQTWLQSGPILSLLARYVEQLH